MTATAARAGHTSRPKRTTNPLVEIKEAVRRGTRKIVKKAVKRAIRNEFKLLALGAAGRVKDVKRAVKKAMTSSPNKTKKKRRAAQSTKQPTRRAAHADHFRAASLSLKGP